MPVGMVPALLLVVADFLVPCESWCSPSHLWNVNINFRQAHAQSRHFENDCCRREVAVAASPIDWSPCGGHQCPGYGRRGSAVFASPIEQNDVNGGPDGMPLAVEMLEAGARNGTGVQEQARLFVEMSIPFFKVLPCPCRGLPCLTAATLTLCTSSGSVITYENVLSTSWRSFVCINCRNCLRLPYPVSVWPTGSVGVVCSLKDLPHASSPQQASCAVLVGTKAVSVVMKRHSFEVLACTDGCRPRTGVRVAQCCARLLL